jgi:hypothetical protein
MRTVPVPAYRSVLMLLPILLVAASCTTRVVEGTRPADELAGVAPVLSVERFLQAVNAQDFDSMARLFGTHDGPFQGEPSQVELQMSILSEILRHQDYRIDSERMEPGREHPTRRVGVDLTIGGRVIRDVAFLVVQTGGGRWLVEQIDVEKVTRG